MEKWWVYLEFFLGKQRKNGGSKQLSKFFFGKVTIFGVDQQPFWGGYHDHVG